MNLVCYPFMHVNINEEEAPDAPNSVVLIYNMYRASFVTCNLFNKLTFVPSTYYCTYVQGFAFTYVNFNVYLRS